MGQKSNPIGLRLGINKEWDSIWFDDKNFADRLKEDLILRKYILNKYATASVAKIIISRTSKKVTLTIHTARPGIVIGRGGTNVEELRKTLESEAENRVRLNVQEIRQPELDAYLVARSVADQLERRIAFRRAIRQAIGRTMQAGAQGVKIICGGRLGGAEIARREKSFEGRVPLHTLRADIDFGIAEAATDFGRIGVKAWIYKGDILPAPKEQEIDMEPIEVTVTAEREETDATTPQGEVSE